MNNVNKLICKINEFFIYFLISFNKYFRRQIKNRKDQIDSYKSQISTDENHLQLSPNLDDFHQQEAKKDQPRVIEQFFPNASILGSQLLVPDLSNDEKRLFMQLDFAKEQNIEDDRYHRTDVERQMKKHYDSVEQQPISNLPSDEKSFSKDSEVHIEEVQPKRLSQIRKSPQSQTEGDQTMTQLPTINDVSVHENDKQLTKDHVDIPSIKQLTSSPVIESAESPHSTEDLSSTLAEL